MAAGDGLISMTPTSIAYSGTSASINADGGVDFSAVTSLSLNGVFTGDYDNYLIYMNASGASASDQLECRLRSAGTDDSSSSYTRQVLQANNTTIAAARTSGATSWGEIGYVTNSTLYGAYSLLFYGPALSQPTAMRSVNVGVFGSARILEAAVTHSASSSFDGLTLYMATGNFTGTVHVFGYEE